METNTNKTETNKALSKNGSGDANNIKVFKEAETPVVQKEEKPRGIQAVVPSRVDNSILSINPDETIRDDRKSREDALWHDIDNAQRKRKIITGTIDGIEPLPSFGTVIVTSYMGQRVIIPLDAMGIILTVDGDPRDEKLRKAKLVNTMFGGEIDFIILKADRASGAIIASREEAIKEKILKYYATFDEEGAALIYPGRVIQARVVGVNEKRVRVEAFGLETSLRTTDIAWEWIADAREYYQVGDSILLKIKSVTYPEGNRDKEGRWLRNIKFEAEAKSLQENKTIEKFESIREQGKYRGVVTDVVNGTYYIHLADGVNAIAHSINGPTIPMKRDVIAFSCTYKDPKTYVAVGIITRVVRGGYGR